MVGTRFALFAASPPASASRNGYFTKSVLTLDFRYYDSDPRLRVSAPRKPGS
jgi:hypothetical protein